MEKTKKGKGGEGSFLGVGKARARASLTEGE